MKKMLLTGLFAGTGMLVVAMAVSWLFSALFPALRSEYMNTAIFRDENDPLMMIYFLHPFIFGMLLAWLWYKTKTLFHQKSVASAAFTFALVVWIVSTIPGMIISYASFQVSFLMITSWTIGVLVELFVAGLICARMMPAADTGPRVFGTA